MGAIASVLQWHCGNCSLINPTEQAKCSRCGTLRQFNDKADDNRSLSTIFGSNANCTVIRKPRHTRQTQPQNQSPLKSIQTKQSTENRLDIINNIILFIIIHCCHSL